MIIDLHANAYARERKGDIKRMRKNGLLPAVIYGHGEDSKRISIEEKDFRKILDILQKEVVTVNIEVEGVKFLCVIKSIQHNPATDQLLHIDFQHIHEKEKIRALVPIHLVGEAPGIKKGGILDHHLHEVTIRCLPADIPSHIDVDISSLGIGRTVHLYDIKHEKWEFEHGDDTPVVSVLVPRAVVAEVKPVAVAEGEAVPELEEGEEKEKQEEKGEPSLAKEETKDSDKDDLKKSRK
jgi:large subunit ribosomal protein L25